MQISSELWAQKERHSLLGSILPMKGSWRKSQAALGLWAELSLDVQTLEGSDKLDSSYFALKEE